jgi:hypothetical protein
VSSCTKDRPTVDCEPTERSTPDDAPETAPTVSGASSLKVMVFMDDEVWVNGRRLRDVKEDW